MSEQSPDFDKLLDPQFLAGGPTERSAQERIAQASRIAQGNERLKREGEIADGVGKPKYGRIRKGAPWIAISVVTGVTIVLLALVTR